MLKDLAQNILEKIPRRQGLYADVRVVWRRHERLKLANSQPDSCVAEEDFGVGVRVWLAGHWGFAATSNVRSDAIDIMISKALASAGSAAYICVQGQPFRAPAPVVADTETVVRVAPSSISWEEKLALLEAACKTMQAEKRVIRAEASLEIFKESKAFVSTIGSVITQTTVHCGGGISAYAGVGNNVQIRSYPAHFGGNYGAAGYEFIEALELVRHAPRVAAEAVELLHAPVCPRTNTTIILESGQLALQIHESIGHAVELDRILGHEASCAGTSFVTPDMIGNFRYASPLVNVTANATVRQGLGSFGFDDEGVPGQAEAVIRNGQLVGVLSSCSTAPTIGRESSGAMRADGWRHFPLVRMTNINLEPGEWTLADLIADSDEGLWLETNRSWSIDDKRLHFAFATEVAREIRKGKLGKLYRNPVYFGTTPRFWRNCDAVCGVQEWQLWGVPRCGKGEPMQIAHVGHGCAPARFRNVEVGGIA
ncbi:MAG: TldD/PmbA family protein [Candidatus Sumerlaeaceae bacterium]